MTRVLLIIIAVVLAHPAFAWEQMQNQRQQQHQRQHQKQNQSQAAIGTGGMSSASGGAATAAGGSLTVNGGVGGQNLSRAPDVLIPSIGGGGADCPVVGFGIGGSGLMGGGGFGPSWISSDCNTRKLSMLLYVMGAQPAAIALLRKHFPEVDEAFKATDATLLSAPLPARPAPRGMIDGN